MSKRVLVLFVPVFSLFLATGCSESESEALSKSDARSLVAKGDAPEDVCSLFGWYDDGICDDFCLYPDGDCETDAFCYSDSDCADDQSCNAGDVCLSPCETDADDCTAVCVGFCVPTPSECFGAWLDETGTCRGPADGVLPADCCPSPCESAEDCEDDEFCNLNHLVDEAPECQIRPLFCYEIYAPVCGGNGVTYGNDCYAHAAGQSIVHWGECEEPIAAECTKDGGCGDTEYCDFDVPADAFSCGLGFPEIGTCRPRPTICNALAAPVCGCDGNTYGNGCQANAAGTDVSFTGSCDDPE